MSHASVWVHYSALQVALIKARMFDASDALKDWADEWIDQDEDETLEEILEEERHEHGAD